MDIMYNDDNDETTNNTNILESNEKSPDTGKIDPKLDNLYSPTGMEKFLNMVGLSTPIDYVFLEYAQSKSRKLINDNNNVLNFLFSLVIKESQDGRQFPLGNWIEKVPVRHFEISEDPDVVKEKNVFILWTSAPSENWEKRDILPITDFHLYVLDILKNVTDMTAEELYTILDIKRGADYFLIFGSRSSSYEKGLMVILSVNKDQILVFHVPKFDFNDTDINTGVRSQWISTTENLLVKQIKEYAVFKMPEGYLVLSEEEVLKRRQEENKSLLFNEEVQKSSKDENVSGECDSCSS